MRSPLVLLAIAAGCYQPTVATGLPCAENGACPSGLDCRAGTCELPSGTGDAPIDVMVDATIDACPAATCSGDDIVGCGAPVMCATGCSTAGGAHCRELVPSNGVTTTLLTGVTANVSGNDWNFDTDSGEIKKGNQTLRNPGVGVIAGIGFHVVGGMAVFSARSFVVGTFDDFDADGDNTLVLYAATTITVRGSVDVGSVSSTGGPGGSDASAVSTGLDCRGRTGRFFSAGFGEGGGGGGGLTAGGNGAASNQPSPTGLGGTLCTALPTTIPLRGGAGGAHGGDSSSNAGGGGGGAVALVAMQSISVTGDVGAPGAGGQSGAGPAPSGDGGGGGGGGGAVFLEAPFVTISGALTANGGGGAAPFTGDGARGSRGSATAAAGGTYTGPGGTASGGRGGTGSLSPGNGDTYTQDDGLLPPAVIITRGGGGGGAAGRIEVKSLSRTTSGATLSPAPVYSDATMQ